MTARRLAAEFIGTAFLLAAIVGSGITASSDGAASAQLFQHAFVVGAALTALILALGPVSGGHFNPAVTLVDAVLGGLSWRLAGGYVAAQLAGAVTGVVTTNLLFSRSAVDIAATERTGAALAGSELLATFGLLVVIFGVVRSGNTRAVPGAVGAYIGAAIYFTSSTSFANPAVSVSRTLSDTYTGIAPSGVAGFVAAQVLAAVLAVVVIRWLFDPDVLDAVVKRGGTRMPQIPTVLFLCVHNAGRSQMAAGWLRHLAGDRVEVRSGGSDPGDQVNPTAVQAMAEVGVDIAGEHPKPWTHETLGAADVIVTMGCGDACPVLPGKRYLDWQLNDPAGKGIEEVRPIRDEIEQRVRGLLAELDVEPVRA